MLKTWMTCPKQAHFKDILNMPESQHCKTTYGTCIHDALEVLNNTRDLRKAQQRFLTTWDNPAILDAEIDVWPANMTWGSLKVRGLEALANYEELEGWNTKKILATEHKFVVPFGEHTLSGIVDSLEVQGSGKAARLYVVDYKTSSYFPTHIELRTNIQFTIYMYAATQPEFWEGIEDGKKHFEKYRGLDVKGVWYSMWHGRKTEVGRRTDLDLMRLYRLLTEIEKAIEHDVYVPSISADSCIYCPYTEICGVAIPIVEDINDERAVRLAR